LGTSWWISGLFRAMPGEFPSIRKRHSRHTQDFIFGFLIEGGVGCDG
jgi:hypothetical protein